MLDAKNLNFGANQRIEMCDMLTPERLLLCVKRATRSSTLSHLFAQGSVSASLMWNEKYQERILDSMKSLGIDEPWGDPRRWKIVYVIATEKDGPLVDSLFFFSQLNLVKHVQDIRGRNLEVMIARVKMA